MWYGHMLFEAGQFLGQDLDKPAMEFGCMDGVNTFALLGGEFGLQFDIYREVKWDKNAHKQSTLKDDYFDTFRNEDEGIDVLKRPEAFFDVGLDWKESHIRKSERLNIFKKLVLCDPGKPLHDIDGELFATIWAPNIYWMENLEGVLSEFRRVIRQDGKIVTIGPDLKQKEYMWFRYADKADQKWLQDIDRGRYTNVSKQARSVAGWEDVFQRAGFQITRHGMFIPSLVGQVYDIGLRPMFPVLMNMYEKLRSHSVDDLLDLKAHWIEVAYHFLSPLCEVEWMENLGMEKLWHIFELRPDNTKY